MNELGPALSFWILALIWMAKTIWLVIVCVLLAWLGIHAFDALTPHIPHRQRIGESPISIGLYLAGLFILVGLVMHGALTAPTVIGGPLITYFFDFRRLGLLALSFVVSLLIGVALFYLVDKLSHKISFASIEPEPVAVGIHVFGYLVFFGLILHAALTIPL
jgi:hypothetical protein